MNYTHYCYWHLLTGKGQYNTRLRVWIILIIDTDIYWQERGSITLVLGYELYSLLLLTPETTLKYHTIKRVTFKYKKYLHYLLQFPINIQHYVIVCQWLTTGRWFSMGTRVSSTNKTDHHDITEILLKVAINTIIFDIQW